MNNLCIKLYTKMMVAKENFLRDETGAVDIVAIVILIGVAVLLATLFKDRITALLGDLLDTIGGKASDAVTG